MSEATGNSSLTSTVCRMLSSVDLGENDEGEALNNF